MNTAAKAALVKADAERFEEACKGFGTDEKKLIEIFARHTNLELQQLRAIYKATYGKDMLDTLKSELSGDFYRFARAVVLTPAENDAEALTVAMKGAGTDESMLTCILGTRDNAEIGLINTAFKEKNGKTLEDWVKGDTSGDYKKLLVALAQGARETNKEANPAAWAEKLYKAGEGRLGTDEDTFISFLARKSYDTIKAVSAEYLKKQNHSLEDAVKKEMSGDLKALCLTILSVANEGIAVAYARQLRDAMKGVGTKEKVLINVLASQRHRLQDIKYQYQYAVKANMVDDLKGDLSGKMETLALALLGTK
jgi:annexin A7/11